jgi:hypothetical protein
MLWLQKGDSNLPLGIDGKTGASYLVMSSENQSSFWKWHTKDCKKKKGISIGFFSRNEID